MVIGLTLPRLVAAVLLLVSGLPAAEAQPAVKVFRIGLLGTVPLTDPESARIWGGFFEGLRQLGYIEGQNLFFEQRYSEGRSERLPALAAELVQLKVEVIVAAAHTPSAAKGVTSTIPIVMTNHGNPLASGLVPSLASLSRVAVLSNPGNPNHMAHVHEAEGAAPGLKVRLQILEARAPTDLAGAFSAATKESTGALLILGDPMFFGERTRIVELATQRRLPLMSNQSEFPEAGGLLAYGTDQRDSFRRAAIYVDKILKATKPADLPVEQATKFELIVNARAAKSLGVTISPTVLARADRLIE